MYQIVKDINAGYVAHAIYENIDTDKHRIVFFTNKRAISGKDNVAVFDVVPGSGSEQKFQGDIQEYTGGQYEIVVTIYPGEEGEYTRLKSNKNNKELNMSKIRAMLVSRSGSLSLSPTNNIAQSNNTTSDGTVKNSTNTERLTRYNIENQTEDERQNLRKLSQYGIEID